MSRVCLLVDHPQRDLDGLVLLGAHLAAEGIEVFLVPMYQKHEVWLLAPDLVLLNYARHAHERFVQTCVAAGIKIAVLDTEGGVRDFSTFRQQLERYLPRISLYCVWGSVQFEALRDAARDHGFTLVETGTPRYDFATAPWINALPDVDVPRGPLVLVNTNFPLINSRFQDLEREIQELVKVGWQEIVVRERVVQTGHARDALVHATREIAERLPEVTVLVRPHPFERAGWYEERFASIQNVVVRQEGTVFQWLKRSSVLVHHNCSTAIEAAMMERPAAMLGWLETPLLHHAATAAVSYRASSPADLADFVARSVRDPQHAPSPGNDEARSAVIRQFFCANDGRSAERVATAILDALAKPCVERGGMARYLGRILTNPVGLSVLQRGLLLAAGNGTYDVAQSLVRRRRGVLAKVFGVDEVEQVLCRVAAAAPRFSNVRVRAAERGDLAVGRRSGGRAVRVASDRLMGRARARTAGNL